MDHVRAERPTNAVVHAALRPPLPSRRFLAVPCLLALLFLLAQPASAACNCQDTDLDGYPDNGDACTGTFAERTSPWNPDPGTLDLTIRFTWASTRSCGMFANGDYWVEVPTGNLELTSITPPVDTRSNGALIHGYQKNIWSHMAGGTENVAPFQSLDGGPIGRFQAPPPVTDLDPEPGDVVIKVIGRKPEQWLPGDGDTPQNCQNANQCIYYAMLLTVLSSAPSNSHLKFRPPAAGRVDIEEGVSFSFVTDPAQQIRPMYEVTDIDWEDFYPRRSDCPSCGSIYTVEQMRDRFAIPHALEIRESQNSRNTRPVAAFGILGDNAYGGDFSRDEAQYAMLMSLDEFDPDPVARNAAYHAAINHIQAGIDYIHRVRDGNMMITGNGGHAGGMSWTMWHAAAALRHPDLVAFMANPVFRVGQGAARHHVDRGTSGTPYDEDAAFMTKVVNAGWFDHVVNYATGTIDGGAAAAANNPPALYGSSCGNSRSPGSPANECTGDPFTSTGRCANCGNSHLCDSLPRSTAFAGGSNKYCSDPADLIDGGGNAASPGQSDYEKEHLCSLYVLPIAVRLFAGGDEVWAIPESYEYAMRRWRFGLWMLPDGFNMSGGDHGTHEGATKTGSQTRVCNEMSAGDQDNDYIVAFRDAFWDEGPVLFDGDHDGVPDVQDDCTLEPNGPQLGPNDQCDADQDGYGNVCDADFNNDGTVGAPDWPTLSGCWGATEPFANPECAEADMNCDGTVGAPDYPYFTRSFGGPPGPSGLECAGTIPCP